MAKIIVTVATATMIFSQSAGCAMFNHHELMNRIKNKEDIVFELNSPTDYSVTVFGKATSDSDWIQLDQLADYPKLRDEMDKILNINIVTVNNINGKSGCLFVDSSGDRNGNTSLSDGFRNKAFIEKYWNNPKVRAQIGDTSTKVYKDSGDIEEYKLTGAINAYYKLIIDNVNPTSYNPTESVSRSNFYTMVYKASNPVNTEYLRGFAGKDDPFVKAMGGKMDNSTPFVKAIADKGFLDYKNKSLNDKNITEPITRVEAVYMVMQNSFKDELAKFDINTESGFKDVKNGGNLAEDGRGKEKWQLYTLDYMIEKNTGMQEELYKAVALSNKLGVVKPDRNGNFRCGEPISKHEAIKLMIDTQLALNKLHGYKSTVEYGTNNKSKFNKASAVYEIVGDAVIVNPSFEPETAVMHGTSTDGEVIARNFDELSPEQQNEFKPILEKYEAEQKAKKAAEEKAQAQAKAEAEKKAQAQAQARKKTEQNKGTSKHQQAPKSNNGGIPAGGFEIAGATPGNGADAGNPTAGHEGGGGGGIIGNWA